MTQHSSDMVERVARYVREHAIMTMPDARFAVQTTLEASHHAELVEALREAVELYGETGDPLDPAHHWRALLAQIGDRT